MSDDPAVSSAPRAGKLPRWATVLLVASLALNLLVAGVVAGAIWHFKRAGAASADGVPPGIAHLAKALPADKRERVHGLFRDAQPALKGLRREVHQARRAADEAFSAESFDRVRLEAAQTRQLDAERNLRAGYQRIYQDVGGLLTVQERRDLVKERNERRPWRLRSWHSEDAPGKGPGS
jgi:uncharacterized membrane protein